MKEAVFTISKGSNGLDLKCKNYNVFNRFNIPEGTLFKAMTELADIFNNIIGVSIVFEVK